MTDVLTVEEIDELLRDINAREAESKADEPAGKSRILKLYDFTRPNKFSREQIWTISVIHETFSRLFSTHLSAMLRCKAHIHVASVDQLTFGEFTRTVAVPATLGMIGMEPLKGYALIEITPAISFTMIDRLLGGAGKDAKNHHDLTVIETAVMEEVFSLLLEDLQKAWTRVIDIKPQLIQIESNPLSINAFSPAEAVVLITTETKINDTEGMINLCIPHRTVESIMDNLSAAYWHGKNKSELVVESQPLQNREDVPVRLTAEMFRYNLPIQEINEWKPGVVLKPSGNVSSGFCFLRLGNKPVWRCSILPDGKSPFGAPSGAHPRQGLNKRGLSGTIKIIDLINTPFGTEGAEDMDNSNPVVTNVLQSVRMAITVELGAATLSVKDVFSLTKDKVIELDTLAGGLLNIKANGVLIAKGEPVVVDENFGIRIAEIIETPGLQEK